MLLFSDWLYVHLFAVKGKGNNGTACSKSKLNPQNLRICGHIQFFFFKCFPHLKVSVSAQKSSEIPYTALLSLLICLISQWHCFFFFFLLDSRSVAMET